MNKILFLLLAMLSAGSIFGQIKYEIHSEPENATVEINGDSVGVTPMSYEFFWYKIKKEGLYIVVSKDGYKSEIESIDNKPKRMRITKKITLKRDLPNYAFDSTAAIVAFDKLVANFREDKVVGTFESPKGIIENIYWEGSIRVGDESFENSFFDLAQNVGFRTPISVSSELFNDQLSSRNQLPRFMVGVKMLGCNYDLKSLTQNIYAATKIVGTTTFNLEWQILDRSKGKVVSTYNNTGKAKFSSTVREISDSDNILAFEDALIDFLKNGELESLVKQAGDSDKIVNAELNTITHNIKDTEKLKFNSISEMITHTQNACVTILTDGGHGSGAFLTNDGLVLSAYHVVDGVNKIEVKFSNGIKLEAKVVNFSQSHDVVLLQIVGSGYTPLPIGKSEAMTLGKEVVTIGTPADLSLGQSVSKGIISGKRKHENNVYIQTDVSVSPGNSGGPLLNMQGEIIGIIQSKVVGEGIEGIGFALPIEKALKALNVQVSN